MPVDYAAARASLASKKFDLGADAASPLTFPMTAVPTAATTLHSPRIANDHGLTPFDKSKYEELMWEVMSVREKVQKGIYPIEFLRKYYPVAWGELPATLPKILMMEGLTAQRPQLLANVVHMDKPVDLGFAIMNYLGTKPRADRLLSGNTSHIDFLERGPQFIAGMATAVRVSLDKAFEAKYHFGIARPEEIYEHLTGNTGKDITHYEDNSYNHPSYPAGHGSAAGATGKFFQDNCNLDAEELSEIRQACYLWAQFRTLAGVHYAPDNIAGLLEIGGIA